MSAPIIRSAHVRLAQEDAFRIFTSEIGAWWPLPSHGMFSDRSSSVRFRDGHLVETAVDGAEAVWGEVRLWEPPTRLVIGWHPGRQLEDASEVEVTFVPDEDGTAVLIEHRGWESFGVDASQRRRSYLGPNAWGYVLDNYAYSAESPPDDPDLAELEAAYASFFLLAESGDFGSAEDGEWDADRTIAHVTLNDFAINTVCQTLVHRRSEGPDAQMVRFENEVSQDPAVLSAWVEAAGNRGELISRGRAAATIVLGGLRRLSLEQREAFVHCRLSHNGELMVDDPRPWEAVAIEVQARIHLPAHIEQLAKLSTSNP